MNFEPYVVGFNYVDFKDYRHADAREGRVMKTEHDIHSLRQMSKRFFDLGQKSIEAMSIDDLIEFFSDERPDVLTVTTSVACDNEDDR